MIKHQDAHSWPQTSVPGPIRKWAIVPYVSWHLVSNLKLDVEISAIIQSHEDVFTQYLLYFSTCVIDMIAFMSTMYLHLGHLIYQMLNLMKSSFTPYIYNSI